jgi:hypothetical protein
MSFHDTPTWMAFPGNNRRIEQDLALRHLDRAWARGYKIPGGDIFCPRARALQCRADADPGEPSTLSGVLVRWMPGTRETGGSDWIYDPKFLANGGPLACSCENEVSP